MEELRRVMEKLLDYKQQKSWEAVSQASWLLKPWRYLNYLLDCNDINRCRWALEGLSGPERKTASAILKDFFSCEKRSRLIRADKDYRLVLLVLEKELEL